MRPVLCRVLAALIISPLPACNEAGFTPGTEPGQDAAHRGDASTSDQALLASDAVADGSMVHNHDDGGRRATMPEEGKEDSTNSAGVRVDGGTRDQGSLRPSSGAEDSGAAEPLNDASVELSDAGRWPEREPLDGSAESTESGAVLSQVEASVSSTVPAPGVQGDIYNREAVVPPMCYTQTTGVFNPCYVCHQDEIRGTGRANYQDDGFLQGDYFFSDVATHNHWTNLFVDRTREIAEISDEQIDAWVNTDNYTGFAERLHDAGFDGYIPVIEGLARGASAFDEQGVALDGSHWVAFNYKPLPSTFWPTNGATDDVMIKLPAAFRQKVDGSYSRDIYMANLAIVEAAVKGYSSISLPEVDEREVGVDLNGDEVLGLITELSRPRVYVGQAETVSVEVFLYPEGTSFLHTVRYVGIGEDSSIVVPPRMKEVRYMTKERSMRKDVIAKVYSDEWLDKQQGALPRYSDRREDGTANKFGWLINGFIEDEVGQLRQQNFEERFFCMGCHNSIGSTIDSTFAFPRKMDGAAGWGYINLHGMPDAPSVGEVEGEILTYLRRVGGGSEFRHNDEMANRFFDGTTLNEVVVEAASDVYELIAPSPDRARQLNKAYKVLVEQQTMPDRGFEHGRDPTAVFPVNVFDDVDPETVPVLPVERQFTYDLRLDWPE